MSVTVNRTIEEPHLNEIESDLVRSAQKYMLMALEHSKVSKIALLAEDERSIGVDTPVLELPPQVLRLIANILNSMVEKKPIYMIPQGHLMSTFEAAHFLNVSRPYVTKLLKEKKIKYTMVGSHHRIAYEDVMEYKLQMRTEQEKALQEMVDQAQSLGMGYSL